MSEPHATWRLELAWPDSGPTQVYDLAHELHTGIPHHPIHPPFAFSLTKRHGDVQYPEGVSSAGGAFLMGDHTGTHVDGLNHVSREGRLFGGQPVQDAQDYSSGVAAGSIHRTAPIMAQARLVDLTVLLGRPMEPGEEVTAEHLRGWFAEQDRPPRGGAVLFRTGYDQSWDDPERFIGVNSGLPGVSLDAARWLTEHGISYTGSDTVAYEVMPSPHLEVHCHLLVDHGVHILESLWLADLSADRCWSFLLLAVPLPLRGGTGSPVRPLAVVPEAARQGLS